MKPDIKAKWLTALRSGDYRQGTGYLGYIEGGITSYCCLGVLCEIVDVPKETREHYNSIFYNGEMYYPPVPLQHELEITEDARNTLVEMNDDEMSFGQIADWIEQNL